MDLSGILAISGYPGLHRIIGQTKGGIVVESLVNGKRMAAYTSQRILSLEDITIYTIDGDERLDVIFGKMAEKENHGPALNPSMASVDELRDYLASVQEDYDRGRVYASDLKKLFQWYNLLAEKGLTKEMGKKESEAEAKEESAEKSE